HVAAQRNTLDRVHRSRRHMREEVIDPRRIEREDAEFLDFHLLAKRRRARRSRVGHAPAYLADDARAVWYRRLDGKTRGRVVPGQIIERAPAPDDEHQPETIGGPCAAVELFGAKVRIERIAAARRIDVHAAHLEHVGLGPLHGFAWA